MLVDKIHDTRINSLDRQGCCYSNWLDQQRCSKAYASNYFVHEIKIITPILSCGSDEIAAVFAIVWMAAGWLDEAGKTRQVENLEKVLQKRSLKSQIDIRRACFDLADDLVRTWRAGQNLWAFICECYRVFKMRTVFCVSRHNGPVVIKAFHGLGAYIDHWLDGQNDSGT